MKVIKKTDKKENYTKRKLRESLRQASKYCSKDIKKNLSKITNDIHKILIVNKEISTPQINREIEKYLAQHELQDMLEAFVYYKTHLKDIIKHKRKTTLDIKTSVDEYVKKSDWRVKENSNSAFSFSGLMAYTAGKIIGNYTLNEMYPKEVSIAHREADFHIHDLSYGTVAYCAGWSLRDLLKKGFGHVEGKVSSAPPKHLSTAVIQIVNFLGTMQMEHAGAQAFSSVDVFLAPFIKKDKLSYKEIKQQVQQLVFSLNVPSRWGGQSPFVNFTLDLIIPKDLRKQKAIVGGVEQDFTFGECQREVDLFNKAFMEVMSAGDSDGRIFYYPIPTVNITKDTDWDSPVLQDILKATAKYGHFYFANFITSDMKPEDSRSMCCRLRLDLRELDKKGGGLFGANEKTGSIGVVTINLAKLGYLSKTKKEFLNRLDTLMVLAKDSLEIKRVVVEQNLKEGLMPFTKVYLENYKMHFSTIGINGMHESCLNFFGKGIETKEGKDFTMEVLDFMRKRLSDFQEETGNLYNLEATPAESTSYRLAKTDLKKYKDIIYSGTKSAPYYTNSTQLPVDHTSNLFEMLDHQSEIQELYTGGTVSHLFIGEARPNPEALKTLIKKVFTNYGLPYISITPTFSICKKHGYLAGEVEYCPKCKEERTKEINIELKKLKGGE